MDPSVASTTSPTATGPPQLRHDVGRLLGGGSTSVIVAPIAIRQEFFTPEGAKRFDGIPYTSEGGVGSRLGGCALPNHPAGSSADAMPVRLVLLIEGKDPNLADWVNGLLACQEAQGVLRSLNLHWILMLGAADRPANPGNN